MEDAQKGFIGIALLIILGLLIIGGGVYYYQTKEAAKLSGSASTTNEYNSDLQLNTNTAAGVTTNSTTTTTVDVSNTADWKTYTNAKYSFQFIYPSKFKSVIEYPNKGQKECIQSDPTVNTTSVQVVAIVGAVNVNVICESLTSQIGNTSLNNPFGEADDSITKITVSNKTSYQHEFTTATGYHNLIAQIPLDAGHYIEVYYSFGNADRLNGATPLNANDWSNIIASFKITD